MYTIVTIEQIRCTEISTTFIKTNGYGVQMLYIFMGCVVKTFNKIWGMYKFYTTELRQDITLYKTADLQLSFLL